MLQQGVQVLTCSVTHINVNCNILCFNWHEELKKKEDPVVARCEKEFAASVAIVAASSISRRELWPSFICVNTRFLKEGREEDEEEEEEEKEEEVEEEEEEEEEYCGLTLC